MLKCNLNYVAFFLTKLVLLLYDVLRIYMHSISLLSILLTYIVCFLVVYKYILFQIKTTMINKKQTIQTEV